MNAMTERTWARDIYAARTIPHPPAMPRTFTHCAGVPWTDQEDWGTYDGIFAMASPPVRANTPLAGQDRYEPGEVVAEGIQAARTKLVIAVCLVCVAVLGGLVWAALRWRVGATWN